MAITSYWNLNKPNRASLYWDIPLNENFDLIDEVLYKLRSNFASTSQPSENPVNGSTWFDSATNTLNLKLPTGYSKLLSELVADSRYARLAYQNIFTSTQDFSGAILKWANVSSSDLVKFEYLTDSTKKKLQISFTNKIAYIYNNSISILTLLEDQIKSYVKLVLDNGTTTSPRIILKNGTTTNYALGSNPSEFAIIKNYGESGTIANLFTLSDQYIKYKQYNLLHEGSIVNADTVDYFHASKTPAANTIPVVESDLSLKIGSKCFAKLISNMMHLGDSTGATAVYGERVYLTANCYWNAALTNWYRINNNASATVVSVLLDGTLERRTTPSGSGPITDWSGGENRIWDSGNDGHGSGLDADKLDGKELSEILGATDPVGVVKMWWGNISGAFDSNGLGIVGTQYESWQICNGQKGSPNLQGRFPFGADVSGTLYPKGSVGGEATHTLTEAEMPSHNHTWTKPASPHNENETTGYIAGATPTTWLNFTVDTDYAGGGQPHNNMPPYMALYFIYKWK